MPKTRKYLCLDSMIQEIHDCFSKAQQEYRLEQQMQLQAYPKLLGLDKIGYLPMDQDEASLFFRLVTRRYEKASIILTSSCSG